jgi:hypothetical protein
MLKTTTYSLIFSKKNGSYDLGRQYYFWKGKPTYRMMWHGAHGARTWPLMAHWSHPEVAHIQWFTPVMLTWVTLLFFLAAPLFPCCPWCCAIARACYRCSSPCLIVSRGKLHSSNFFLGLGFPIWKFPPFLGLPIVSLFTSISLQFMVTRTSPTSITPQIHAKTSHSMDGVAVGKNFPCPHEIAAQMCGIWRNERMTQILHVFSGKHEFIPRFVY